MHAVEVAKSELIAIWAYMEGHAFGSEFQSFDDAKSVSSGQRIRAGKMYLLRYASWHEAHRSGCACAGGREPKLH